MNSRTPDDQQTRRLPDDRRFDAIVGALETFADSQDAVFVKDLEGRYLMVNEAASQLVGRPPEQIVGRTDVELFGDAGEDLWSADEAVIGSGRSTTVEEAIVVGGALRVVLTTKTPLYDAAGEVIGTVGVATDITARKRLEDELADGQARLEEAQAVARVGSWEWDVGSGAVIWSAELRRIFGLREAATPSFEAFVEMVHPEDRERVAAAIEAARGGGAEYDVEHRIIRADGSERLLHCRGRVIRDLDGSPLRMLGAATDITDRRLAEEALRREHAQLEAAEELSGVGSFQWEIEADSVTWSGGLYRIFGVAPADFPGTFEAYLDFVHPEDREARAQEVADVLETGEAARSTSRIVRADGEVRWIDSHVVVADREASRGRRVIGACRDVTERMASEDELRRQSEEARLSAMRDPLTGLPNRTLAMDRLEHALVRARRTSDDVAVLFLDIDGFKRVNDDLGHAAGDQVLHSVAERLIGAVRGSDTVARIGGDEFVVVCEQVHTQTDATRTAERVVNAFAEPFAAGGKRFELSLSTGIALARQRKIAAAELLAEADAAMYETKRGGRSAPQP